ncbi:ATP-binding protein [Streptomyces sp. MA5143a]|uniref:ATP-binding protein n=1 Tax=Streptomyces sp. MA5143a TaxID=2083010 RepID=UPI000D1BE188|nr:ATP-binding protein [Streptomyces sp. MA5143a]SPF02066.1 hypothetical protein SMA5143A_2821 [Streptomyces sp. MA5143a]
MSLPLTRRIAHAALLTAAGAASVVGAAGSASAAPELPATPDLGGLSAVDGAHAGNTVDGATQSVTGVASNVGGKAAKETLPTVSKTGQKTVKSLPTDSVAKGGLPTGKLPVKSPLG